jgi:hypothetical protein
MPVAPPIRLLFLTGEDWFSVGIRAFTRGLPSHVALAFGPDGSQVVHAVSKGVRVEAREQLYTKYLFYDVAEFGVVPDVRAGLQTALTQVGKPYDKGEIYSRLINKVVRVACPWVPEAAASDGEWTCARFAMLLDPLGARIPEWRALDPKTVTPVELLRATEGGLGSFRRIR